MTTSNDSGTVQLRRKPVPEIRLDLLELFERAELSKYLTEPELSRLDAGGPENAQGSDQS